MQTIGDVTATFGYSTTPAVASTFSSKFNTSQFDEGLFAQGEAAAACTKLASVQRIFFAKFILHKYIYILQHSRPWTCMQQTGCETLQHSGLHHHIHHALLLPLETWHQ